jgi:hypothetical protein
LLGIGAFGHFAVSFAFVSAATVPDFARRVCIRMAPSRAPGAGNATAMRRDRRTAALARAIRMS